MKKEIDYKDAKYAVFGGQYYVYFDGYAKTLEGAKRLATKNIELWDNWQGWHTPDIYRIEDVLETAPYIDKYGNWRYCILSKYAEPAYTKSNGRWYECGNDEGM